MIIALQTLIFFRESLFAAIDRLLRPYYKHFSLSFNRLGSVEDDEESEDHVFAEFDEEKGVVFFPPMYVQRYAAVSDCLVDERWSGKLEKVVDFGYHDMSFIKYLKEVPGIKHIMGVDIESIPLRCSSDLLGCEDYILKRENPLQVTLYQGNAADPDYRLIGCDAVIAIEMIEHMLPHDLERLVHTIFGFIKPWIAVITTPNGDFNALFKAMEKNGLRRLDHFFEWSREQFHDWCSNIVVRYPQYTVSCRGIGPGPPGTLHYGCCSQLALFVAKDYHKQQDLNLNSLALVPKVPTPTNVCDIIGRLDSPVTFTESNMICSPNNIESYTELIFSDQSCVTIVLSPAFSIETLECHDKTAQCNLDTELGKNFLMFDEEPCFDVLVPRRKIYNRVYVIEDVNSRLNCTTLQVKKFSKTTQNMLAKNKVDCLVHTREVVDDIKHLTRMLNFKNETKDKVEGEHLWYNINWGDNAPYWNQYYKTVREYSYPFEAKSEECRIVDLISDEINRLIDMQFDEELSMDVNKVEIPIRHLMRVVQHITEDEERVRDLLEWNGYEVTDEVVIYSRLVVDNGSLGSLDDEWRDDALSDWDTDVHSTSFSDGSTIMPDYYGRCLYRALDHKVRKLRSMLSADEDITVELDRVVCRLMKMALRTTRGRDCPLSMKWMQCKMLDLLTLTEKSIEKKKKCVQSYPLKAICYEDTKQEELDLSRIKEDTTADEIVQKYRHLVRSSDNNTASEEMHSPYQYDNIDDDLSHKSSKEFLKQNVSSELNFDDILKSPSLVDIEPTPKYPIKNRKVYYNRTETPLTRTQAWVEEDGNVVRFSKHSSHGISSGDTDQSMNNITRFKSKKGHKRQRLPSDVKDTDLDVRRRKKSSSKTSYDKHKGKNVEKCKHRDKNSKTRILKNVVKKKSSYNVLIKTCSKKVSSANFGNFAVLSKRNLKQIAQQESAPAKPIPVLLKEICRPEIKLEKSVKEVDIYKSNNQDIDSIDKVHLESNIASTKECLLIDIITEDREETIALRRTIGTDADEETALFEQETILGSLMNVMKADDSFYINHETENVHSQTLFIYDINEPSTSKGLRHVSMDVQCGPDVNNALAMSAATSFTRMPKIFNTGFKIGNSAEDIRMAKRSADFGTSTCEADNNFKTITPRMKSVGIRIKDSDTFIHQRVDSGTMTLENVPQKVHDTGNVVVYIPKNLDSATETQMLKPVSSRLKMEDSGSEFCESVGSSRRSPFYFADLSKNTSDFQVMSSVSKDVGVERKFSNKYVRPKLSCGGVHVHSYKDRQMSEDVVYQGEWQRYRPKAFARRRLNSVVPRRLIEVANKKSKAVSKENILASKDIKLPSKRLPVKNVSFKKLVNDAHDDEEFRKITVNMNKNNIKTINRSPIKVATKLVTSTPKTKPNRVTFVTKKPSMTSCTKKESENLLKCCKKCYLPLYLKRKLASKAKNDALIKQTDSAKTMIENFKVKKRPIDPLIEIVESAKNETKNELLEGLDINFEPRENVSYVVFHNETDQNPAADSDQTLFPKGASRQDSYRRSPSPQSQNSSAYSSPNSIATVRARPTAKMISDRRYSTSSNKSNLSNSQSESTPVKNKKFTKRAKSAKKSQDKDYHNKGNVPESSKKNPENEKSTRSAFMRNKSVYRAHVTTECSPQSANNSLSRHRPQTATKSNVRIPTIPCSSSEKQSSSGSTRPPVSKKSSRNSRSSLQSEHKLGKSYNKSDIPSISSTSQHEKDSNNSNKETNQGVIINIVDNSLLAEWMNSSYKSIVDSHTSNILAAMRHLVEERLDFIERPSDNLDVDSKTVDLSQDKLDSATISASTSFHDSSSINNSFGTVIEREENVKVADINDIQNIVNNTLDSILGKESFVSVSGPTRTDTDLDLLSYKSLTSASKLSEYFLAESSLNNVTGSRHSGHGVPISGSVRDIFERRNQLSVQNLVGASGALAVQAFSGFSMNAEPIAGDKSDRVNIIDSETGSIALEYTRQATSEELFVSGRSSDSYESCLIDEDAVVPYWLFQIISHQQSIDEEEEPEPVVPIAVPLAEPMFDMNGNVLEPGMGASAGAGDGRGIHSDHSQDSSGRGTSLSSSATSSGPESEAILIDPSVYPAPYDLIREPIGSTILVPVLQLESPDTSFITAEGAESSRNNDILNSSGEGCERTAAALLAASDVDADISSIDTDAPDSSDN